MPKWFPTNYTTQPAYVEAAVAKFEELVRMGALSEVNDMVGFIQSLHMDYLVMVRRFEKSLNDLKRKQFELVSPADVGVALNSHGGEISRVFNNNADSATPSTIFPYVD
jgi:hypothetical protein